jgi:hypothetical protein
VRGPVVDVALIATSIAHKNPAMLFNPRSITEQKRPAEEL